MSSQDTIARIKEPYPPSYSSIVSISHNDNGRGKWLEQVRPSPYPFIRPLPDYNSYTIYPEWFEYARSHIQTFIYRKPTPFNQQIVNRLNSLCYDALDENEEIIKPSVHQFIEFFFDNRTSILPKITLTPNGTLRARWIYSDSRFFAVEFTGNSKLKLVFQSDSSQSNYAKMATLEVKITDITTFAKEANFRL